MQIDFKKLFPRIDPKAFSFFPIFLHFYEGVIITDHQGTVLFYNDKQAKIDDLDPNYVLGKKIADVYRVDDGISPMMLCLKNGNSIDNLASYYRTCLGRIVNSIHNVYPLHTNGVLIGAICFIRDYRSVEQTFETISKSSQPILQDYPDSNTKIRHWERPSNGTRFRFEDIVGSDTEFLNAVESAQLAAKSPSPILLFGETGTGKELLAQSIHNAGPRKKHQYIALNCAAIPENLMEGILFGTVKGAFTDAMDKPGLFEKANHGTLLLDEVNSMPKGLQAKLLRVLQEKKVRRVGSLEEIDVDIKIISSVNNEPYQAIKDNELRADLFYRLGVVFIRIPPLRERKVDIDLLIRYFLHTCNQALGKDISGVSSEVMTLFLQYHWPGNVRELEHVIEGAMNMVRYRQTIELTHLSVHEARMKTPLLSKQDTLESQNSNTLAELDQSASLLTPVTVSTNSQKTLNEIQSTNEQRCISEALTITGGNAAQAAKKIGISPQLLQHKLKKYRINRKSFKIQNKS
jgi:arginine utilization regulatory protein